MAIKIIAPTNAYFGKGVMEVLADAESDITALGATVSDGTMTLTALPGSIAYTADLSVAYQLSPSGVWTKTV